MKKTFIILLLTLLSAISVFSKETRVEGVYQGESLIVNNPFGGGILFCIYKVTVNGLSISDDVNSSSFEIDLTQFNLKHGDKVVIIFYHRDNCKPKILNLQAIEKHCSFQVVSMELGSDGNLKWTTTNESCKLPFIVEQFIWNKWVKLGKVEGTGTNGPNNYLYKVDFHSGKNRFRLKQVDKKRNKKYSKEVKYTSLIKEVKFKKVKNKIMFTAKTKYELYDGYGQLIKKASTQIIDLSKEKLKKGSYYLNYDNKTGEFTK